MINMKVTFKVGVCNIKWIFIGGQGLHIYAQGPI